MTIAPNIQTANFCRLIAAFGWCLFNSTWLEFAILVRSENRKWMTDLRRILIYLPSVFFFIGNIGYEPGKVLIKSVGIWEDTYPINYFEILYIIYYVTFAAAGILIIYKWGKISTSKREKKQANIIIKTSMISFVLAVMTDTVFPLLGIEIFPFGVIMISIALLGIWHAITKYKMMSLSAKAANDYILRTMNDPVIIIGNDFLIKEINGAALDFMCMREEELMGLPIMSFIDDSNLNQSFDKIFAEMGYIKNIEVELYTKYNNRIPSLLSAAAIKNEFDEAMGIACVFHDITHRKNAEIILLKAHQELESKVYERTKELKEINLKLEREILERTKAEEGLKSSEEKFRAVMKQASDGILVIDQDTRKVLESNQEACEILEFTEEQLTVLTAEQLIPEYKDMINTSIDKIIAEKGVRLKGTVKYTRRGGMVRDLEIAASKVGYSNKQFVMVKLRDVTEKQKMEEQKQHLVKMESLGTLAGGIAHDFNNILAGIMGYTQLTLEDLEEDASLSDNLSEVLKLGERAKKLISQILTFSRKTIIKPDIVDFRSIVAEVLKMLKTTLPVNIEIQSELKCDSAFVFADQGELHQLIMNLCVNAEHAMVKNGGILQVVLKKVKITKEREIGYQAIKPGDYISLKVIDNGCGMEEAIKQRIFEPFFTTRGVHEGTGLGLSVVHGIVSRYEGVIMVESKLNIGSTFTVFLPCVQSTSNNENHTDNSANKSPARILLVDDEESIVNTVQRLLRRQGYNVAGVLGAQKALELFAENKDYFDIVLTDQSMPGMTGDSLVKELRGIRPEVPVVVCSGYSYDNNFENGNSKDITEFLLKPVSKSEYVNAIERLLVNKKHSP